MPTTNELAPQDLRFYRSTLYQQVLDGGIASKAGTAMMETLRGELIASMENVEFPEYTAVLGELYKVVTDSLISAVHRNAPHERINQSGSEFHIATDEGEYQLMQDDIYAEDDVDDIETHSSSNSHSNTRDSDPKQRKRDEVKKKRREEEEMLLNEKKVLDEKNNVYRTIGPFPAPRLTVRSSHSIFPSRKALQHRTTVETPSPSTSSSSDDEGKTTVIPSLGNSSECGDAVDHLIEFLKPLSLDSLKKVGESAKAKLRPSSPHDEFVPQIAKTAVRLGCEKACALMDRQKIIDDVTTHVQTGTLPTTASIDFLNTLPDNLKQTLGNILGLPEEKPPVVDMWERIVAMGFLSVLTNLRLKPLKKIVTELNIELPESNSTETFCEAIVFSAFPRERLRAKMSKAKQKRVKFAVPVDGMYTKGDMGFISFEVLNISMLARESDRHYSPEFSFAQLKWSLLCMTNKESLALYLCQTGSVHCKFLITVINQTNQDDSICNEGTQSFSAVSQENDWGFNNVIKFNDLMNLEQGFVNPETDSILIQVGIVLVEPLKPAVAREKSAPQKEKKAPAPIVDEAAVRQLLEDEKTENLRKKIKQDLNKTIKEEERTRKDIAQRGIKAYHDLSERLRQETKRVLKELADRERREEQERQMELDKIRHAQEQTAEMMKKLEKLKKENVELNQERQQLTHDAKEAKIHAEKLTQELKGIVDKVQSAQQKVKVQEKKLESVRISYQNLADEGSVTSSPSEEDETDFINANLTRLIDEMTVDM
ncbi:unnamed protein product [Phytomonas sp. Hart1]|nr:unnamed protein product [Phytomonas sp. Hart1]|eukprot:CCW67923.1 unnamed protein product [Phytomonas sp. isolate Hart1]